MLLAGELRATCILVLAAPQILGQGPIISLFELGYVPVPPGLLGGWVLLLKLWGLSRTSDTLLAFQAVRVLPLVLL